MKRSSYASPYAIWMVMFTLVPLLFVVYFAFYRGATAASRCAISKSSSSPCI